MNFFRKIIDGVKQKTAELQEKKQFLQMVENETKPIRRAAYLAQKRADALEEGKAIAQKDTEQKLAKTKKPEDFGIGSGIQDPYKYLKSGGK